MLIVVIFVGSLVMSESIDSLDDHSISIHIKIAEKYLIKIMTFRC